MSGSVSSNEEIWCAIQSLISTGRDINVGGIVVGDVVAVVAVKVSGEVEDEAMFIVATAVDGRLQPGGRPVVRVL
jgi:hypothetical protein